MLSTNELLRRRCCSDRLTIIEGATGEGVTWLEVADQARRWADSGLDGPVGLALADPVAMATNFVAALAAGVVVAPLDPSAPARDLGARIDQLGLRSLVLSPASSPPSDIETWTAGRRELRYGGGSRVRGGPAPAEPSAVAALMASSGTTGEPKIIPLTADQLLGTAAAVADHLSLDSSDRGYSPLPLFHINGLVVGVLSALVAGSAIVVDRSFSRRAFWPTVARSGATWLNLVPAILAILGTDVGPLETGEPLPRLARSASAPLPEAVRERFEALTGIPVIETYGMTEAASQITANPIGRTRPGSVGIGLGLDVRVVDADGAPIGTGTAGSVHIRGRRVTSHYWRRDADGRWDARPAVGVDGWLVTGDIGRLDEDGYLTLIGREGDVINRGGEKVHPRDVEEVLLSDPRVAAAVVVGRPHPTTGEEPVAYVLPVPGWDGDAVELSTELLELCAESLSRFKRPAAITVAESLPAGPTGKVRRAEVRALAATNRAEGAPASSSSSKETSWTRSS